MALACNSAGIAMKIEVHEKIYENVKVALKKITFFQLSLDQFVFPFRTHFISKLCFHLVN